MDSLPQFVSPITPLQFRCGIDSPDGAYHTLSPELPERVRIRTFDDRAEKVRRTPVGCLSPQCDGAHLTPRCVIRSTFFFKIAPFGSYELWAGPGGMHCQGACGRKCEIHRRDVASLESVQRGGCTEFATGEHLLLNRVCLWRMIAERPPPPTTTSSPPRFVCVLVRSLPLLWHIFLFLPERWPGSLI